MIPEPALPVAPDLPALIREIGRGAHGARDMTRSQASALYAAMLANAVPDLELGAILLAMRIKGESAEEIAGFLDAVHAQTSLLALPRSKIRGSLPILIPSYNGARKLPNLTPLLALLLARQGAQVIVHGFDPDSAPDILTDRVTTAAIWQLLGLPVAHDAAGVCAALQSNLPVFATLNGLSPGLLTLLRLRARLGLRSSAHTLVKLLQPIAGPALRLASFTHPEYQQMLQTYLLKPEVQTCGPVLLMRGTEGEAFANPLKSQQILCFRNGTCATLAERHEMVADVEEIALLPERSAVATAHWIEAVIRDKTAAPRALVAQADLCLQLTRPDENNGES